MISFLVMKMLILRIDNKFLKMVLKIYKIHISHIGTIVFYFTWSVFTKNEF